MVRTRYRLPALPALIFLILTLALASASPAQEKASPRGTLKVVDLMNGATAVIGNYAEGLLVRDKDNNLVPCLAESWKWVSERTIEFKLRRAVSFHNGDAFNAEAVRINWEAYRQMKAPAFLPFLIIHADTLLEIVDGHTVRFTFPEPDGLALVKFATAFGQFSPTYLAGHKFPEGGWGAFQEPGPWGTGPFKLVEGGFNVRSPSERVVLEANENYWDKRYPKVKRIIFDNTLMKDVGEATRLCGDTEGTLDIVSFIRPLDTLKVAASPFAKVVKSRDSTQTHSAINQRKKESKWRDIRLRKALNYAINGEELLEYGAKGNAYNLRGHIPPGVRGHNPDLALYPYDTTKARALLSEAGFPNGFEMILITPEAQKLEAQVMKAMYERIGLTVKLEVYTQFGWLQKIYAPLLDKPAEEQEWDVSVCYNNDYYGHSGASHLVYPFLDLSGIRWIEYDAVYEQMWKDMARTVDEAAQDEKMRQLEQYIFDHAYAVFIYSPLNLYAVNKEVDFVPQKSTALRLMETSVTDNHWSVRARDETAKPSGAQTKQ
jgi:peptide/nickel transport system substrate-binding protein